MHKSISNTLLATILAAVFVSLSACGSKPATSVANYIGIDSAKEAALKAANISSGEIPYLSAGLDCRNDIYFYQVAFTENGINHTYEIDALTGTVIGESHAPQARTEASAETPVINETPSAAISDPASMPTDMDAAQSPTTSAQQISGQAPAGTPAQSNTQTPAAPTQSAAGNQPAAQAPAPTQAPAPAQPPASTQPSAQAASREIDSAAALSAALSHAGVSEQNIVSKKVETDIDNGRKIFEVEFLTKDGVEYDYDISASDGSVISFDYDAEMLFSQAPAAGSTTITADQAKQAVLSLVPGAAAENIMIHLDEDDGRLEYEGSLIYDSTEYEFKIDAYNGNVIEWEVEPYSRHR